MRVHEAFRKQAVQNCGCKHESLNKKMICPIVESERLQVLILDCGVTTRTTKI